MIKPLIASCFGAETVLFRAFALHQNNGHQPVALVSGFSAK